jgi:hypothetical protein
MSTIRNPTQKKTLSLKRDRRNVYRENSKATRKCVPRAKQRRHRDERRAVAHVLRRLRGDVDEDIASLTELEVKVTVADSRNRGFKKIPDQPLEVVLARKNSWSRATGERSK